MAVNLTSVLVILVTVAILIVNYSGEHKSLISCFNYKKCTGATMAAILIVMGVLISDQRADLFSSHPLNQSQLTKSLGTVSFVVGWLVLAWLVIPTDYVRDDNDSDKYHTETDLKKHSMNWYTSISAMLVMVTAMIAQYYAPKGMKAFLWPAIAFMAAWIGFGVLLGWKNGEYRPDKLVMSLPGAILIVLSMGILFMTRKMNIFDEGKLTGPGHVYNPGLVLFTLGWVLIIGAISKIDEKTEVCG